MKFCPNCGNQLNDNEAFCGNCGTSMVNGLQVENTAGQAPGAGFQYGAQQGQGMYQQQSGFASTYGAGAEPPKKSKKPLIIALVAVACLVAAVGIFFAVRAFMGGGTKKADEKDFLGIQMAYFEERFEGSGAVFSGESFSSDVTVSGSFESSDPDMQKINKILDGSAIIFKIDAKKNDFLYNVVLNLQGSNILEADFTLTDKEFGFAIPAADNNYYVGDLKTALKNFGVSEADVDALLNSAGSIAMPGAGVFADSFKSVLNAGINENNLTITKKTTINLDKLNQSADGTLYTWIPTKEDCKTILDKLADEMEAGTAIGEIMKQMEQMGGSFSTGDMDFESMAEAIENFRANADTYAQQMADSGFKWEMATNGDGKVVMISVSTDEAEFGYQGLVTDKSVKEQFFVASRGNTLVRLDNEAVVSGKKWTGTLSLGTPSGSLPVDYDLDTSKYSVYGMPYGTVSMNLAPLAGVDMGMEITTQAGDSSSTDMTVKFSGIGRLTNGLADSMEITVNTTNKSSATKPSGTKVDVSNYTEEDYSQLFQTMTTNIGFALLSSPAIMDLLRMFY